MTLFTKEIFFTNVIENFCINFIHSWKLHFSVASFNMGCTWLDSYLQNLHGNAHNKQEVVGQECQDKQSAAASRSSTSYSPMPVNMLPNMALCRYEYRILRCEDDLNRPKS
jgi:hypothetical protein